MMNHVFVFAINVLCVFPSCWCLLLSLLYYFWRLAATLVSMRIGGAILGNRGFGVCYNQRAG